MTLPAYEDHLLPRNSSALERVLSASGARMQSLPVDIDLLKRPLDVPVQFLPHLAFELSVDVWKKRWSATRQRAVTAAALILQAKKGTAYCLREYARYADAEVIKIERPPMRVFSGKSLTKAEREAWLAGLPQIRLWRIAEIGTAGAHKAFLGGRSSLRLRSPRFCFGWPAPTPSTALSRLKARARWVVNGVETDIRISNVGTVFRLHMPGLAGLRVFCNRPVAERFYIPSDARFRLVTVAPAARLPWRSRSRRRCKLSHRNLSASLFPACAGSRFIAGCRPALSSFRHPLRCGFTIVSPSMMAAARRGAPPYNSWASAATASRFIRRM